MSIILLTSISLFALAVTSRPILPELNDFAPTSSAPQNSIQALFRVHPGKDDLTQDVARLYFQQSKHWMERFSDFGKEAVATIASFPISPDHSPSIEVHLDGTPDRRDKLHANNAHDNSLIDNTAADDFTPAPLLVLILSCIAASLALACIGLLLYVVKALRFQILASKAAWELLPRFRKNPTRENVTMTKRERLLGGGCLLLLPEQRPANEERFTEGHELCPVNKPLYFGAMSDMESEWDDVDEKYQDSLDMTPLPLIYDLPLGDNASHPPHHDGPPIPRLVHNPLESPALDRSTPLMNESCSSPPLVPRPAWSVRAIDSPTLGLSSRQGGVDAPPQPLIHPPRRAYRSPVPEFDIALAMQLRPGLGLGADSAWMVRFLMAIFGWFAVAVTGNAR